MNSGFGAGKLKNDFWGCYSNRKQGNVQTDGCVTLEKGQRESKVYNHTADPMNSLKINVSVLMYFLKRLWKGKDNFPYCIILNNEPQ